MSGIQDPFSIACYLFNAILIHGGTEKRNDVVFERLESHHLLEDTRMMTGLHVSWIDKLFRHSSTLNLVHVLPVTPLLAMRD